MDNGLLAPCGIHCRFCGYYTGKKTPRCPGCRTQEGHPFWGDCKLYACAKRHEVEHCGICQDFPCDLFVNQFDPEHGQKSAFTRAGLLAFRKRAGTEKFVEVMEKLQEE